MYATTTTKNTHDTAPITLRVCNLKSIYERNSIYIKETVFFYLVISFIHF